MRLAHCRKTRLTCGLQCLSQHGWASTLVKLLYIVLSVLYKSFNTEYDTLPVLCAQHLTTALSQNARQLLALPMLTPSRMLCSQTSSCAQKHPLAPRLCVHFSSCVLAALLASRRSAARAAAHSPSATRLDTRVLPGHTQAPADCQAASPACTSALPRAEKSSGARVSRIHRPPPAAATPRCGAARPCASAPPAAS